MGAGGTWTGSLLAAAALLISCSEPASPPVTGAPGDPLPGLDAARLEQFTLGRQLFHRQFEQEDGLGPLFNQQRCSSCHDLPALGGTGVELAIKATRFTAPDRCDLLVSHGGDTFQERVTPVAEALGVRRETVPPDATARANITPPSLFGLGLVEAIPADVLLALEDPEDRDGDGISGRAGRTQDGQIGRFGRKGTDATLLEFIDSALRFEMGLTTPLHPMEELPNGQALPDGADPIADPEINGDQMNLLVSFVRYLAPPAPAPSDGAARDSVERGRQVFADIGCADCHVPTLTTGPNAVPAFDRKTIALYSDLLLHDLGPNMASICGRDAAPSEFRTARLAGLRFRNEFLHDGRAGSVNRAILMHGGEGQRASDAYATLDAARRAYLLRFLDTL
jgi:CxxC motif-containing protein (DUF1111 family)